MSDLAERRSWYIRWKAGEHLTHHCATEYVDALEAEVERSHALLQAVADARNLRDIEHAINRIRGTHQLT